MPSLPEQKFPVYPSDADARCWKCNGVLEPRHQVTEYPPGRGQWCGFCSPCNCRTWYDVAPPQPGESA